MDVARSIALFGVAAIAEIGGAYLVWQAIRGGQAWWLALLGGPALFAYGFVATLQSDPHFGRILADFRPDRFDLIGAAICPLGVGVIMYAPRG
jgi:small multidrug resistance family-3 protein